MSAALKLINPTGETDTLSQKVPPEFGGEEVEHRKYVFYIAALKPDMTITRGDNGRRPYTAQNV